MSLMRILSSNVTRKWPSGFESAFFIWPLMPETVRTAAPWNLAISRDVVNISRTNAVFRKILYGDPVSFSFFTISVA